MPYRPSRLGFVTSSTQTGVAGVPESAKVWACVDAIERYGLFRQNSQTMLFLLKVLECPLVCGPFTPPLSPGWLARPATAPGAGARNDAISCGGLPHSPGSGRDESAPRTPPAGQSPEHVPWRS